MRPFPDVSLCSLPTDKIHIWGAGLSLNMEEERNYWAILTEEEKIRASKFRFPKDRIAFIASRGMLRTTASHYLDCHPGKIEFTYHEFGKPGFAHNTSLQFNVSHSGARVVIAFVNQVNIGIDIERIKKDIDVLDIADNFFSTSELDALHQIDEKERIRAFYRCWTRKESFIKAEGSGLSFPLDNFSVTLDTDLEASLLDTQWSKGEKDKWSLFSFIPYEGYIAAISVRGVFRDYLYKEWNHSWGFL